MFSKQDEALLRREVMVCDAHERTNGAAVRRISEAEGTPGQDQRQRTAADDGAVQQVRMPDGAGRLRGKEDDMGHGKTMIRNDLPKR
jgi:hypothetical protein